jgi:hypothetical protein
VGLRVARRPRSHCRSFTDELDAKQAADAADMRGRVRYGVESKRESSEVIMARTAGRTYDERSGSDGTRTRDLRRDRPAF